MKWKRSTFTLAIALVCLATSGPALRGQSAPPTQPANNQIPLAHFAFVEAFVPESPTIFFANGRSWLCYEVHLTNWDKSPWVLERVTTSAADGAKLAEVSGSDLTAALSHPGKSDTPAADAGVLAGGERVVYYAWVVLPQNAPAPLRIHHMLTFKEASPKAGSAASEMTIEAAEANVTAKPRTIVSPLRGENWLAANGPSNTSGHRKGVITLDGKARIPQRFATDWLQIDKEGHTFKGDQSKNESYYCYGKEAHAVADGVVTEVKDGIPQNTPGINSRAVPINLDTVGGNHVIIDLGGGIYAFYAHLQPGSLRVKMGEHVKTGEVVGLVGNSGNSTEPHLHFHLIDKSSPLAGEGVPFSLPEYKLQGKASGIEATPKLEWLPSAEDHRNELPIEDEIVTFPK